MKRHLKFLAIPAAAVATLTAGAVVWALWSSSGTGNAATTASSLASPTNVVATATPGSGNVPVTWTGITSPSGVASDVRYYVERSGGDAACDTTSLTCSDTGVPDGSYTYTVKAVFQSWSAISLPSNQVTVVNDNTPPTAPAPGVTATVSYAGTDRLFVTDEPLTLTSGAADTQSGMDSVTYSYCAGASGTCTLTEIDSSTDEPNDFEFVWSAPGLADGPYRIVATSLDNAGNDATSPPTLISVDTTPPTVSIPTVNG